MNVRFIETTDGLRRSMTKEEAIGLVALPEGARAYRYNPLTSARSPQENDVREYVFEGKPFTPGRRTFSTNLRGLEQLCKANRLFGIGKSLTYVRYLSPESGAFPLAKRGPRGELAAIRGDFGILSLT